VNVKDGAEKDDGRKEMEIADDKPKGLVKRGLKSFCLFKDSLGNGVLIAVSDIGEAHGFELAAGAFLVAENTPFAGFCGIILCGHNLRDSEDHTKH
jgi:hypothetical protein